MSAHNKRRLAFDIEPEYIEALDAYQAAQGFSTRVAALRALIRFVTAADHSTPTLLTRHKVLCQRLAVLEARVARLEDS